jgi:hypothetical protein
MENKPFFSGLCYCIKNFNNYRLDDDKFTPDKYYKTTYESNNTIFVIIMNMVVLIVEDSGFI